MAMTPQGSVPVNINLRSAYDSTLLYQNDAVFSNLGTNSQPIDTALIIHTTEPGLLRFEVRSVKEDRVYRSPIREVSVFPMTAQSAFVDDLNSVDTENKYISQNFSRYALLGLSTGAWHTNHPYDDGNNAVVMLKTPIIVAAENAILTYDDIALVEPGDQGTVYGDQAMWDYVIVEGTSDGLNWRPLLPGYDARFHSDWLTAYQNAALPQSSMFVSHTIDLQDSFNAGELIFIRFRLYADDAVTGWGWVIDNINIQADPSGSGIIPSWIELAQNKPNPFPTPFNPVTTIDFSVPEQDRVAVRIFDILGQEVITLLDQVKERGRHAVQWNGKNSQGKNVASGVYIYRIQTAREAKARRLLLIR
jgi:hypothetical protein